MVTRADVIAEARSYIGTRYRDMGRRPGRVLDCGGVVECVGNRLGLTAYQAPVYGRQAANPYDFMAQFLAAGCSKVFSRDARPGDILIVRDGSPYPCHCGILAEKDREPSLIHATLVYRQTIEQTLSSYLSATQRPQPYLHTFAFSYPGLED